MFLFFRNRYPLSKLLETMAYFHFAAHVAPFSKTGVIIDITCPGLCNTSLARDAPQQFLDLIQQLRAQYGRTAEDGSRTLLHAVVAGKEAHGKFLHSCDMVE